MNLEEIVKAINEKEIIIAECRDRIKNFYEEINQAFQLSGGFRTSDIDEKYKKIDSNFGAKAKLEGDVRDLKKQLLEMVLSA